MKNYLIFLKKILTKNKKVYIPTNSIDENNSKLKEENKKLIDIAKTLGLEFTVHSLEKVPSKNRNCYYISDDNMIFLYPVNDGMPTFPFAFYKGDKLILHNQNVYSEIENLDEIILQIVRIYNKALDKNIVIDPYYFMLKLDDEFKENYKGNATLVITEKAIRNQKLNEENFIEATKYFINRFLDHFIGWNFGVSINRNETLKQELEELNNKVIDKGLREYAGSGFEVHGVDTEVYQGLQHYYLPTDKNKIKKLSN